MIPDEAEGQAGATLKSLMGFKCRCERQNFWLVVICCDWYLAAAVDKTPHRVGDKVETDD